MLELLNNFFLTKQFIPHGHCYLWKPGLVWLHIVSDSLIGLAYYSIPITLVYFVRKRHDLPFNGIFLLFGAFIVACGTTHLMEIWTLWHPTYWLSGAIKAITALVSVYTALELVPLVPKALALPSPAQLEATNQELLHQITQRQLAESALQLANDELETKVRKRTTELAKANEELRTEITQRQQAEAEREQLLQREQAAREQAEVANRFKDEFLAILSHELRTPLNPILGWSSLLQQSKLDAAKTTQALATIERNAKLQVQLIDDLLDLSRILRGKLSLTVAPVDLSNVVCAALETVSFAAEAKLLQIELFSSSIGLVNGDAGRLQQAVWNLLSNAIKFTPAGGRVEVRLEVVNDSSSMVIDNRNEQLAITKYQLPTTSYAQIQVIDTGKGIQPDFLPYVFEHFRQEDGATTRKFGGLGLGLAIVRQLVELHGGRVFASSPGEGQGATFTIQIPLAPKSVEMPATAPASESPCDLSGIRILLVDDDVDSREFIAFVLEQENALVTAVSSGIESLQAFAQSIPHIIVSDIGMPEIDGYMLMRQIRMLPPDQGGSVPAIALTAYAGEFNRQQAIKAGFQRHLAKPINPNVLVNFVVELVRQPE
jgi:signal transduction histidine kinase